MANPSDSKEFMLILRGGIHPKDLPPERIQQLMQQFDNWMRQMQGRSQLKGAGRLEDGGRLLSRKRGQLAVDGPYVESKEVVGGYFLISAADLAQAMRLREVVLCSITKGR
jgi:hypothetical protein